MTIKEIVIFNMWYYHGIIRWSIVGVMALFWIFITLVLAKDKLAEIMESDPGAPPHETLNYPYSKMIKVLFWILPVITLWLWHNFRHHFMPFVP